MNELNLFFKINQGYSWHRIVCMASLTLRVPVSTAFIHVNILVPCQLVFRYAEIKIGVNGCKGTLQLPSTFPSISFRQHPPHSRSPPVSATPSAVFLIELTAEELPRLPFHFRLPLSSSVVFLTEPTTEELPSASDQRFVFRSFHFILFFTMA